MPRHHIHLITLDQFSELNLRLANHHRAAPLLGHVLNITRIHLQLLADLTVG